MSLRDIFAELHKEFDEKDALDRYTAAARVVVEEEKKRLRRIGDSVPAFELADPDFGEVSSTELLQRGPLVVNFYRGLWCPLCQKDLLGLDAVMREVHTKASAVAITQGISAEVRRRLREAHVFSFPLINDVDGVVAKQFGIRWSPDDYRLIEAELGIDIATLRDGGPWIFPMQARYVIATDGTIIFTNVVFDYTERSEPSDLISVLSPPVVRQ
jgi:peroxiredoxin